MTHKRGRGKAAANDELESPEKKVKLMDVSNQELSEEENQEVENEGSNERFINTRQRAIKEKLKIQLGTVKNSKKNVQVQTIEAPTDENVESTEDNTSVPANPSLLNVEYLNTVIGVVPQTIEPSNENQVVTDKATVDDNDQSLKQLMMDLDDVPSEPPIEQAFVISIKDGNHVILYPEPIKDNVDINSADTVEKATTDNAENENTGNILIDRTNVEKNPDEPKVDSPPSEKITSEILMKGAKKLKSKKAKSKKLKTKTSLKSKVKGKHDETKSNTNKTPALPIVQHIANETFCNVCERKLDCDLKYDNGGPLGGFEEGAAILDSRLLLFDGDEANVSTEDVRSYNKITEFR